MFSNDQAAFEWPAIGLRLGNQQRNEKGTELFGRARSLWQEWGCYFLILPFLVRAADPYLLLKHFRHRRSRRLTKLGAKSSLPQ